MSQHHLQKTHSSAAPSRGASRHRAAATRRARATGTGLLALLLAVGLSACGGQEEAAPASSSPAASASSAQAGDSGLSVSQPWIKAAGSGMTAAFGTITNTTDREITIVSARSAISPMVQLHRTTQDEGSGGSSMMEQKEGFALPAGGTLELAPGGDHVMFMDLTCALLAGEDATFTLTTSEGKDLEITAPVRDYAGAQEHYDPSASPSETGMDMDMHEHAGHGGSSASASALPTCSK